MYGELESALFNEIYDHVDGMIGLVVLTITDRYPDLDFRKLEGYLMSRGVEIVDSLAESIEGYLQAQGEMASGESDLPEEFDVEEFLGGL